MVDVGEVLEGGGVVGVDLQGALVLIAGGGQIAVDLVDGAEVVDKLFEAFGERGRLGELGPGFVRLVLGEQVFGEGVVVLEEDLVGSEIAV